MYAGFFTGLFETGLEDKQGEYLKPLLIEHKKIPHTGDKASLNRCG